MPSKKLNLSKLTPIIRGTADELITFAVDYAKQYDKTQIDQSMTDIEADLSDAHERLDRASDEDFLERRAAVVSVAARALALLAVDEQRRGARAVTRDMKQIDELGFVKR